MSEQLNKVKRPPPPIRTKSNKSNKSSWGTFPKPGQTLSSLLTMQDFENQKPRVSKISWLDDVLVYRSSIIPVVIRPVVLFTLFSAAVATASIVYGSHISLTNNVVPLLSVVVGLLLVFRNSSAYERYAEGRKDFTALISNARNLSRSIWINVIPPPDKTMSRSERAQLTQKKKELIRLVLGFVFATKHYLRSEGGVHHADLRGLLPRSLVEFVRQGSVEESVVDESDSDEELAIPAVSSPRSYSSPALCDEERNVGVSRPRANSVRSVRSVHVAPEFPGGRPIPVRRPTAVRVRNWDEKKDKKSKPAGSNTSSVSERTPLIKSGVRCDVRRTADDVESKSEGSSVHLGSMVEVGLPLVIAHEISRSLFRFRRQGYIEVIGPAGFNAMQGLVQSMIDQLGSMERIPPHNQRSDIGQTPLPYVFTSHLKQCVTIYLLCLPFVLVEVLGWKTIWIVMTTAFTLCGVEGIAAQIEQPFGTDPSDLNLDLFCTEILCECEAVIERLPEGDQDDDIVYVRSPMQVRRDEEDGE